MSPYQDPTQERMSDGRAMADLMPRRGRGMPGVIVSPATKGGVPVNYNPHDLSNMSVTIEPDGPGKTVLNIGKCTNEEVQAANAKAAQKYPGQDIESQRERALYAFQLLAKPVPTPPPVPPAEKVAARSSLEELLSEETMISELESAIEPEPAPAHLPVEQIDRTYSPMAAFGLKKRTGPSAPPAATPSSTKIGPPQRLVYFEKEGIGTVPAFFHDVIVAVTYTDETSIEESGFMVLIYDTRFEQSAARWFPPSNDPYNRPWAVQISGENKLYLVHTTGFQYVYDSREYCILLVEKAVITQGN